MKIYNISSNNDYKGISGITDKTVGNFHYYQGQSLQSGWTPPVFALTESMLKKKSDQLAEQKLDGNFDARCHANIFLIKEIFIPLLRVLNAEFLPVIINGLEEKFVFMNMLSPIEAVIAEGLDFKQTMEMFRSKRIHFNQEKIGQLIAFRDKKFANNYYCVAQFIELVNSAGIRGLRFDMVGEAS